MVPIFILWFLWKIRKTILHGGAYHKTKLIWKINDNILKFIKLKFKMQLAGRSWPNIMDALQAYKDTFQTIIVRWFPPQNPWLKGNTDGSSRGNSGPSSIAFGIRDVDENLVVAKGSTIPDTTSLVAEVIAIRECLLYCRENSIAHIMIEIDSRIMFQIVQGVWEPPWSVTMEVKSIKTLMATMIVRVVHFLWEGNTLVNFFTNLVLIL